MAGPAYARRLVAEAHTAGADIRTGVTVLALRPGPRLTVSSDEGVGEIAARRVIIATGARETPRSARLVGGTKPGGVMNTGTLQGLVYLKGERPFRRPLIVGTELVAFSAILTCRHAGIRPVAMVEEKAQPTARWPCPVFPRLLGIPLWTGTRVEAVEGERWVEGALVRDPDGRVRHVACDGVVFAGGFRPDAVLVRDSHLVLDPRTGGPEVDQFGRTSDPAVFAAGNLLRPVETAGWSFREGQAAARAVARDLAGTLPAPEPALRLEPAGDALAFVLPQRVVPGAREGSIQLRAARPVHGSVSLRHGGEEIATFRVDARPERRILLPLSAIPPDRTGHAELTAGEVVTTTTPA
jgi:thioredoxin reductase